MAAVPVTTFRQLYSDPANDPYRGAYGPALAAFEVPTLTLWSRVTNHTMVLNMGEDTINAYVGLFVDAGYPMYPIYI